MKKKLMEELLELIYKAQNKETIDQEIIIIEVVMIIEEEIEDNKDLEDKEND